MRPWTPFSSAVDGASLPEAAAHAPILVVHVWAGEFNEDDRRTDVLLRRLSLEFRGPIEFRSLYVEEEENKPLLKELRITHAPALILCTRTGLPRSLPGPHFRRELRRVFGDLVADWAAISTRRSA